MINLKNLLSAYADTWTKYATRRTLAANEINRFYGERISAIEHVLSVEFGLTRLDLGQLALAADSKNPDREEVDAYIRHLLLMNNTAAAV